MSSSERKHIFVVDDEEDIRELLIYNIENDEMCATAFSDGKSMIAALKERRADLPDLIILDLMMPGMSGLDVCRRVKNSDSWKHIPIIMLTARSEESDIVLGLELGADDYVTKPFSFRVLKARMRALLRRPNNPLESTKIEHLESTRKINGEGLTDEKLFIYDLEIDMNRFVAKKSGVKLDLTKSEFQILILLSQKPGWVFSRSKIINRMKGEDYPVTERSIDVQITGLRKKLHDSGELIQTVRGIGYKMKALDD